MRPYESDGLTLFRALADFETLSGSLNFGWSPIEGMRRGKWKLIRSSETELYDLDADPAETKDVHESESAVASDLEATLSHAVATWEKTGTPAQATAAPLDADALTRLASLGYVGGTVTSAHRGGPSPRTMAHLEGELLLLQDMMIQGEHREALTSVENVLRDDPGNRLALSSGAVACFALRDLDGAKRYGRELLKRYPEFVPGVVTQGRVAVAEKDYKSAEAYFRDGLAKSPDEPILVYSLALSLIAQQRAQEAQPLVEKALRAPGADAKFRVVLALCRAIAGDAAGAKAELSRAVAAGYDDIATLRNEPLLAPLRKIPGFEEAVTPKKGA
jgi:tetratricopeptide (TPR) repeat protein